MKLLPNFISSRLPVSRKTHEATLAKKSEEQQWMLGQLRQVTAHNLKLERELGHKNGTNLDD